MLCIFTTVLGKVITARYVGIALANKVPLGHAKSFLFHLSAGNKPWNPEDIKTMVDQKLIVLTPAQAHDDHFIIGYAKERDGFVVTNDMFRDHIAKANDSTEQEAIRTWCAERIIPYTFVGQEFVPEPSKMTNLNRHVNLHYVAGCPNVTHQLGSDQSFPSERNPPLSVTEHSTREASYFESTCSMDLDTDVTDFAFSHAGTRPETNAARALRERPVQREDVSQVRVSSERRVKVDKHLESLEKESKESFLRQLEQTDLPHFFYKHFANIYSHVFQNAQMRVMAKIRKAWREHFNVEKVEYTDLPETVDSALPTLTIQVTTRFLQRYTSILKEEYDDGEVTTEEKANEILWGSDVQKLLGEEATTAVANAMQQT